MSNPRTTALGLLVIAIGAIHGLKAHTLDGEAMTDLSAGVGLILAQDARRTSSDQLAASYVVQGGESVSREALRPRDVAATS